MPLDPDQWHKNLTEDWGCETRIKDGIRQYRSDHPLLSCAFCRGNNEKCWFRLQAINNDYHKAKGQAKCDNCEETCQGKCSMNARTHNYLLSDDHLNITLVQVGKKAGRDKMAKAASAPPASPPPSKTVQPKSTIPEEEEEDDEGKDESDAGEGDKQGLTKGKPAAAKVNGVGRMQLKHNMGEDKRGKEKDGNVVSKEKGKAVETRGPTPKRSKTKTRRIESDDDNSDGESASRSDNAPNDDEPPAHDDPAFNAWQSSPSPPASKASSSKAPTAPTVPPAQLSPAIITRTRSKVDKSRRRVSSVPLPGDVFDSEPIHALFLKQIKSKKRAADTSDDSQEKAERPVKQVRLGSGSPDTITPMPGQDSSSTSADPFIDTRKRFPTHMPTTTPWRNAVGKQALHAQDRPFETPGSETPASGPLATNSVGLDGTDEQFLAQQKDQVESIFDQIQSRLAARLLAQTRRIDALEGELAESKKIQEEHVKKEAQFEAEKKKLEGELAEEKKVNEEHVKKQAKFDVQKRQLDAQKRQLWKDIESEKEKNQQLKAACEAEEEKVEHWKKLALGYEGGESIAGDA